MTQNQYENSRPTKVHVREIVLTDKDQSVTIPSYSFMTFADMSDYVRANKQIERETDYRNGSSNTITFNGMADGISISITCKVPV